MKFKGPLCGCDGRVPGSVFFGVAGLIVYFATVWKCVGHMLNIFCRLWWSAERCTRRLGHDSASLLGLLAKIKV